MKCVKSIVLLILPSVLMLFVMSGCLVQKTPYIKTSYYKNTVARLDSMKPEIGYSNDSIYAGFSRLSITPELNIALNKSDANHIKSIPIAGFGQLKSKYATGIHDSIFVKAVALRVDEQTVVIVSADLLIMPTNIIDSVTTLLLKAGIQRSQLFFTATHTHSSVGGWGYGLLAKIIAGKKNPNIEKWLTKQIVKSVLDAISDLYPAKIGIGGFNGAPYIRNRINGDPLLNNNDFDYLLVEQNSRSKAIIGSFSAHSTTVGSSNTLISADYPGYWQRKMESVGFDMAMFCGGSMGSQSPVGLGTGYERAKYIGEALADSSSFSIKKIITSDKATLSLLSLKIFTPKYHMRLTSKINLSTGFSKWLMPLPKDVYLQVLQINNLVWIFTPCDFSGELALTIKKLLEAKGYRTMVTGYNGSYVGYIIPSKYFYLDYSESKAMGWFGPTMGDYTMDIIKNMVDAVTTNSKKE